MKIYETQLNQNQYTAVKSIHCENKPTYKGEILTKSNRNELAKSPKFHITKKCEVLKQNEVEQVAEISANIENKPLNLEGLFKKFNNR